MYCICIRKIGYTCTIMRIMHTPSYLLRSELWFVIIIYQLFICLSAVQTCIVFSAHDSSELMNTAIVSNFKHIYPIYYLFKWPNAKLTQVWYGSCFFCLSMLKLACSKFICSTNNTTDLTRIKGVKSSLKLLHCRARALYGYYTSQPLFPSTDKCMGIMHVPTICILVLFTLFCNLASLVPRPRPQREKESGDN